MPEIYRYRASRQEYWIIVLADDLCLYLGDYETGDGRDITMKQSQMERDIAAIRSAKHWERIHDR